MLDFFFKALNELELGVWSWINDIVITQHSQKLGYSKCAWIEIWSEIIAKSYNLRRSESIGHGNWRTCHHVWINNRLATWFQVSVTRYMMSYSSTTAAFFHIASSCHVIWNYRKGGSIFIQCYFHAETHKKNDAWKQKEQKVFPNNILIE